MTKKFLRRFHVRFLLALILCSFSMHSMAEKNTQIRQDVGNEASVTRVLVMLNLPAPHFRPDTGYSGSYGNDPGNAARHRIAASLAQQYDLHPVEDWPMPALKVDCYVMEDHQGRSPDALVSMLNKDDRVEWAQSIQTFEAMAAPDPLAPLQPSEKFWHLSELHKLGTGRNVRIAIVDSGVDDAHPDLSGQIVSKENFIDNNPYVAETHGTQVAGIIGAKAGNGIGIVGIAPNARLMALRACWQNPGNTICDSFTLGKAINFAILNNAQIINLSLAGPADKLLQRLVQTALARGIAVVAAVNQKNPANGFPAAYPGVLAVADSATKNKDARILIAPGLDIPTTTTGARWTFVSGSSFSAAHISGLAALLNQLRPSLKPAQLLSELTNYGPGSQPAAHVVDACATVQRISGQCACSCPSQ